MKTDFLVACLAFPATLSVAAEARFGSGPQQTALIELYTSEGCSSCPPAESWMSRLKDSPGLWKQFVPIAFHVDYWDRLGWRDRFSSTRWTERQRRYASLWESESVYTPAVVVNGREQRGLPGASFSWPNEKQAGVLNVTTSDGTLPSSFDRKKEVHPIGRRTSLCSVPAFQVTSARAKTAAAICSTTSSCSTCAIWQ